MNISEYFSSILILLLLLLSISCDNAIETDSNQRSKAILSASMTYSAPIPELPSVYRNDCTAKTSWASEYVKKNEVDYTFISRFPPTYRKAIYSQLNTTQKYNIRDERLGKVLKEMKLTDLQRNTLELFRTRLTPEIFQKIDQKEMQPDEFVDESVFIDIFGKDLALNIFASLSPVERMAGFHSVTYSTELSGRSFLDMDCNCSLGSNYNMQCTEGTDDCEEGHDTTFQCDREDGCGFMGWYECDGFCPDDEMGTNG